mmetsp:Transcript_22739/g.76868  ORF Transcript_22739/g.76868 Transcript_22739/m.76868 type:complete len:222 (+) Transcript_22739:1361-2026(+)
MPKEPLQRGRLALLHRLGYSHQAALSLSRGGRFRHGRRDVLLARNRNVLRPLLPLSLPHLRHRRALGPLRALAPQRRRTRPPLRPSAAPPRRVVGDVCGLWNLRVGRRGGGFGWHGAHDDFAVRHPPRGHGEHGQPAPAHARLDGRALGRQRLQRRTLRHSYPPQAAAVPRRRRARVRRGEDGDGGADHVPGPVRFAAAGDRWGGLRRPARDAARRVCSCG